MRRAEGCYRGLNRVPSSSGIDSSVLVRCLGSILKVEFPARFGLTQRLIREESHD